MTKLRACESCARHVRVSETSCPFCGVQLSAPPRAKPLAISAGMSRAQRLAIAAAAVASQAAMGCAKTEDANPGGTSGSGAMVDAGTAGASGAGSGGMSGGGAGVGNAGVGVAVYGAPVFVDSGMQPDASNAGEDSGQPDSGGHHVVPLYGASPKPGG